VELIRDDGGRASVGYKGTAGDCVIRAIAIATEIPYQKVYKDLFALNKKQLGSMHGKSPMRGGTRMRTIKKYLSSIGWTWVSTMKIGQGCRVHLKKEELPTGNLIVRVSKHLVAVIDGVIYDNHDCSRDETRCVYGYFIKAKEVGE